MKKHFAFLALLSSQFIGAQNLEIVPLGVYGGGDESNLSAYLIGESNSNQYLALDAGTLRAGIQKAIEKDVFPAPPESVLRDYIKGYFISHGHLDHLSGLIINSPEDHKKPIYALPFVIDILKNNYFTNASWSNFGDEGESPILGKYAYMRIYPNKPFNIAETNLTAEVFQLSHVNPQQSSALLVHLNESSILYLGDTGADRVEQSSHLQTLWQHITPLIKNKSLKAILIEVSFSNKQPEDKLFGHLTPKLLQEELGNLEKHAGKGALKGLPIIITHLKPGGDQVSRIKEELTENPFEVRYIFPEQGKRLSF